MRKLTHTQILNIAKGGLGFTHHKYKYSQEYLKPILKRMVKDGLIKQIRQDKTTVTYRANP